MRQRALAPQLKRHPLGGPNPVRAILAALTVLAVACGRPRSAADHATASNCNSASGTQFSAGLYQRLLAAGNTRTAVLAGLGEPATATVTTTPNRHVEGQIDTVVQWTYNASHYEFLVAGDREFLVHRRAFLAHPAIAECVGHVSTPEAAALVLGPATWTDTVADTAVLGYEIRLDAGPAYDAITLHYVRGQLVAIAAVPYLD